MKLPKWPISGFAETILKSLRDEPEQWVVQIMFGRRVLVNFRVGNIVLDIGSIFENTKLYKTSTWVEIYSTNLIEHWLIKRAAIPMFKKFDNLQREIKKRHMEIERAVIADKLLQRTDV